MSELGEVQEKGSQSPELRVPHTDVPVTQNMPLRGR